MVGLCLPNIISSYTILIIIHKKKIYVLCLHSLRFYGYEQGGKGGITTSVMTEGASEARVGLCTQSR